MRRTFKLVISLVIVIYCLTVAYPGNISAITFHSGTDTLFSEKSVTITAVGDIMLGTSYPSPRYLPPQNNPERLIESLLDTLKSSNITFGNLEGSFLNNGEAFKQCRDTAKCYLFRMPEKYVGTLSDAGFDIVSLANNHFGDFGWTAARRTKELLDSVGIKYAGPVENPYSIFTKDSVIYGFCAFLLATDSTSLFDLVKAESIVRILSDTCDIVIVSFHGGAEGSDYQRVPKKDEFFYSENRGNVYEFAHRMIDNGADVVLGHGPHVTRALEVYNNRFVSYSLGNFCTYGRFNLSGPNGYAPIIKLKIDKSGKFLSGRIIPVYQDQDGVVRNDEQDRVIKKIRELMTLDFPDAEINVSDDGKIFYK
jgi:hypothetical protein